MDLIDTPDRSDKLNKTARGTIRWKSKRRIPVAALLEEQAALINSLTHGVFPNSGQLFAKGNRAVQEARMSFWTIVAALAGLFMLSSCASLTLSQDLQRLQSQVALADERITQLERVSTRTPMAVVPAQTSTSGTVQIADTTQTSGAAQESSSDESSQEGAAEEPKQTQQPVHTERTRVVHRPTTSDIQRALHNAGHFKSAVDGNMGPVTREAIREFQRMSGLQVDGIVGNKTWSQLNAHIDILAGGENKALDTLN